MTLVVVVMIDIGALLAISAWENQSLRDTWTSLMSGKSVSSAPGGITVRPAQPGDPSSGNPITGTSGNFD